ncbi:hypothetical protein [Deinococcus marmoris]|nr:hypothetical protein [Deinococcus marmoris]
MQDWSNMARVFVRPGYERGGTQPARDRYDPGPREPSDDGDLWAV